MNEETMRMKLAYWAGIIKEARTSGMKISDWCDKNQISHRQYYYWHGKVIHSAYAMAVENKLLPETTNVPEQALPSVPDFAELSVPRIDPEPKHDACTAPAISISCNDFLVTVGAEFSERELMKVLRVMKHV